MPIGNEYLDAITGFEGFTPKATWDYKQWSNGYGTRARYPGEVISQAEAKRRYQQELEAANRQVKSLGVALDPGKEAALTDLTYNAGSKWMSSGLGQAVKAGDWNTAKQRFLQYNKAGGKTLPGLVRRRMAGASWLGGEPPQASAAQPAPTQTNEAPTMPNQTGVPIPASYSPDTISAQRRMAMQLMQQGTDASPVQHWTQALARVLQGGMGGYQMSQADKQDRMMQGEGNALMGQFLGSVTGGPSPAGMPPQQPAPDQAQMLSQALAGNPAPMTQDQQNVGRFASPGLAAALPQQAAVVPPAPPVQVADAGPTIPPEMLQRMLANPKTRPMAEKYIMEKMKGTQPDSGPAAVQEFKFYEGLSPERRAMYDKLKRDGFKDVGDAFVNPATGQVVPKNLAEKEIQEGYGKDVAKTRAELPETKQRLSMVKDNLTRLKSQASQVLNSEGLGKVAGGLYETYAPNVTEKALNAATDLENLKVKISGVVLQSMRDMSKTGGAVGQVTEREWPRLEGMIANLDTRQGLPQFKARLQEIFDYADNVAGQMEEAYQADLQKAQMAPPNVPQPAFQGARPFNKSKYQGLE